jgi:hypothetical protein
VLGFLAPLFFVHLLNLLFHDANGLVEPDRVLAHPLDFNRRKPFAGVLCWLAQRLEMPRPHQEPFTFGATHGQRVIVCVRENFHARKVCLNGVDNLAVIIANPFQRIFMGCSGGMLPQSSPRLGLRPKPGKFLKKGMHPTHNRR